MGLFDFFKGRRDRETPFPEGMSVGDTPQTDATGGGDLAQLGEQFGNLGNLGEQIQQAFKQGNVTVTEGESNVLDLRGSGARDEILEVLREHGVAAEKGDQVNVTDADLQQKIFGVLAKHGLDAQQLAGAAGAAQAFAGAGALGGGGDTVSKLEQLQKLRESGTLSEDEFQKAKQSILGA